MKKFLIKRLLFIPFGIAAFIVTLYAQYNPDWTEQVYSLSLYPMLSTVVGFLPSLVSFAVDEWLVVVFLLFCLGYIFYYVRKSIINRDKHAVLADENAKNAVGKDGHDISASPGDTDDVITDAHDTPASSNDTEAVRKSGRGMIIYRGVMGMVAIFCVVYFAFTALCGLNYYRYSFSYYTGYSVEQSSVEELEQLCLSLAEEMEQTRTQLGEDTDLSSPASGEFDYYSHYSVLEMQALAEQYPVLNRPLYSAPKPVVMSELMSDAGIGGIFFPFTLESNINVQPPFFTIPATMEHELAHQCGFMREDEANFIAYLACKQSDDPLVLYSGFYLAFNNSISALKKVDPDRAAEIVSNLSPAIQRDREQNKQFWLQHEGALTDFSRSTNDAYLKANRQTDGVDSYGRMVDLLLAEQRAAAG